MTTREIAQAQELARTGLSEREAKRIAGATRDYSAVEVLAAWIVLGDRRAGIFAGGHLMTGHGEVTHEEVTK